MQQLSVSDIMQTAPDAVICAGTTVRSAAETLLTTGCSILPVHDHAGQFCGVVAESAVIRSLLTSTSEDIQVTSILARHVDSVRSNTPLSGVLHLFRSACNAVVPVLDADHAVVGLLHRCDVARLLLSDSNEHPAESRESTRRPFYMSPRKSETTNCDKNRKQSRNDER